MDFYKFYRATKINTATLNSTLVSLVEIFACCFTFKAVAENSDSLGAFFYGIYNRFVVKRSRDQKSRSRGLTSLGNEMLTELK